MRSRKNETASWKFLHWSFMGKIDYNVLYRQKNLTHIIDFLDPSNLKKGFLGDSFRLFSIFKNYFDNIIIF